ncbi:unnamed protein product [Allacma fusca]|uniref:Transglutaminase-like domain-containing protein n=1 Tax=Allacma fusca TaxID=39272 RepID=A0A8J2Q607_9HEXA|nr:unnamed protein product [Allacma fusca]
MTGNQGGANYSATLGERLRREHEARRQEDREREERILNGGTTGNDASRVTRGRRSSQIPLKISAVHWYIKDNATNHRTERFELVERTTPILRRGQAFFVALRISERLFREHADDITVEFLFGSNPSPIEGTHQILKVKKTPLKDNSRWSIQLYGHDKNAITLQVRTSADAMVGIWRCQVKSNLVTTPGRPEVFQCPEDIYLLFNPWERSDTTYMPDKELLDEYVLNDKGKIWVGSYGTAAGRPWNFAQFDDSVLPCTMLLLERSVKPRSRGNPVLVSRALSKMVNSNDDRGILVGNWSGKYEDGKAPSAWTGSLAIVEDYFEKMSASGRPEPVKYGQCWVFAGVLATLCRAIGIPCRVVTNFESAHDANETLTIDRYYDDSNKELNDDPFNPGKKDSIWNFHVWNDVWMARPDLEVGGTKGYGGWQAIDATPQETSEGVFQCGPASLEAVRKGQLGMAFDVSFILAEVNADLVHWKKDREASRGWRRMNADKFSIGRMILTKQPNVFDPTGDSDRVDVLQDYKAKEGTRAERLALYTAAAGNTQIADFYGRSTSDKKGDVEFSLLDLDKIPVGDPFDIVVTLQNKSKETRTVQANIRLNSMYYTGLKAKEVKDASGKFVLRSEAKEELKMTVRPEEYMKRLVEYGIMKVSVICVVDETTQAWLAEDDFQIQKPCLQLDVKGELKIHQPASVKISFENPLDKILTNCSINYEGPGLVRTKTVPQPNAKALEEFHYEYNFVPKSIGNQRIVISFTSKELTDIIGSAVVDIVA